MIKKQHFKIDHKVHLNWSHCMYALDIRDVKCSLTWCFVIPSWSITKCEPCVPQKLKRDIKNVLPALWCVGKMMMNCGCMLVFVCFLLTDSFSLLPPPPFTLSQSNCRSISKIHKALKAIPGKSSIVKTFDVV